MFSGGIYALTSTSRQTCNNILHFSDQATRLDPENQSYKENLATVEQQLKAQPQPQVCICMNLMDVLFTLWEYNVVFGMAQRTLQCVVVVIVLMVCVLSVVC